MGRAIVITSGKGGVDKTTTTANLGAALAQLGHSVVLVDADIGLRNLDVVMGLENRIVYHLVDAIRGKCSLQKALIKDRRIENLWLLPASQTDDKDSVTPDDIRTSLIFSSRRATTSCSSVPRRHRAGLQERDRGRRRGDRGGDARGVIDPRRRSRGRLARRRRCSARLVVNRISGEPRQARRRLSQADAHRDPRARAARRGAARRARRGVDQQGHAGGARGQVGRRPRVHPDRRSGSPATRWRTAQSIGFFTRIDRARPVRDPRVKPCGTNSGSCRGRCLQQHIAKGGCTSCSPTIAQASKAAGSRRCAKRLAKVIAVRADRCRCRRDRDRDPQPPNSQRCRARSVHWQRSCVDVDEPVRSSWPRRRQRCCDLAYFFEATGTRSAEPARCRRRAAGRRR